MAKDGRTADDVEAELAVRKLPGQRRTWLDLVEDEACAWGALVSDVCKPGHAKRAAAAAKHRAWLALHKLGYSYMEIAAPWGADHTSVIYACRKLGVRAMQIKKGPASSRRVRAHAWSRGDKSFYERFDPERPVLADGGGHRVAVGTIIKGRRYDGVVSVAPHEITEAA